MASTVDLHTHTTASDGMLTPAELVHAALERGLETIAVTDHDTVDGILPAIAAARGTGLRVLPGVELSALHRETREDRNLHLLGYGFDPTAPGFVDRLRALAAARVERARQIVRLLADHGAPVPWARVSAQARGTVGRPHIARALVEAGYATDVPDAFARFIGRGCPAYVPSARLSTADVAGMVRAAGGAVALAHPLLLRPPIDLAALLAALRVEGLGGVEVYHSEHDASGTARLRLLAAAQNLWWSGGSDFHGPHKPEVGLGGVAVPPDVLAQGPFPRSSAHRS